jgi:LytS/YehU family sensor histidine kinase
VLNNENEASIDYLSEFATLMRQILDNSARSKVSLQTELEMLRSYIQLEHLRFDCFKWDITLADNVLPERIEVPGMIVQPFVENAILHGLIPKGQDGMLNISLERVGDQLICTVDDNGIGRVRSAELNARKDKSRQSHGVNIATTRLTLLNNRKTGTINKVVYTDKMDGDVAAGTRVTIQIPIL